MRKNVFMFGALFIMLSLIVFACKKEIVSKDSSKNETSKIEVLNTEVTSNEKMLIFSNVEAFEKVASNNSFEDQSDFLNKVKKLNFVSYSDKLSLEKSNLDLVGDEFLSNILNEDLVVQVGEYLYKINKSNSAVFVLSVKNISQYKDLVGENISNENILVFSTEDNVFELLDRKNEKAFSKSCQSSDEQSTGWIQYADFVDRYNSYGNGSEKRYKFEAKFRVRYDNWGIYRKLFTEFTHNEKWFGLWDETYFTIGYIYKYNVKGGGAGSSTKLMTLDPINNSSYTGTEKYEFRDDNLEIIHYRGTKCLSSFDLQSICTYRDGSNFKPRYLPTSGFLRISKGY